VEVSGQLHASVTLALVKAPLYLLDRKVGGQKSRSERCGVEKNLTSAENRTPFVQPLACGYIDRAIPAPRITGVGTEIVTETGL
jgi:hypothetical protein